MSRNLLAVKLDERGAVTVAAQATQDGLRITHVLHLAWPKGLSPWADPGAAGALLREQFDQAGIAGCAAVGVLPREAATLRCLDLPLASDDELVEIVPFQAEGRAPLPLDELSLDYFPLSLKAGDTGRRVLLATARRSVVSAHCQVLRAAGCPAGSLLLDSTALMEILRRSAAWPTESSALAVVPRGAQCEVLFAAAGYLVRSM